MSRILLPLSLLLLGILSMAWSVEEGKHSLKGPHASPVAGLPSQQDTVPPVQPRYDDFLNDTVPNPFDLQDPSAVEKNVEYDPETGQYIITEKIGEENFRPPTYMTFEEYLEYSRRQQEREYFRQLSGVSTEGGGASALDPLAKIDVENSLLDRLFGGTTVDIRPQGGIDLTLGMDFQRLENPILTERQRSQGGFDFDMNIQMNVTGKIGEKLNLATNYNTNATFDFDNQIKLNYNSDLFSEDEILKRIDAGNVSLPLRGSLIQGAQSLFGVITELQFGHLRLTAVASQQKSQRENIQIKDGGQVQEFEVRADEYDENRHFFLTHYNRDQFEFNLENLPQIKSLFRVSTGTNNRGRQQQVGSNRTNNSSNNPNFRSSGGGQIPGGVENLQGIEIWITNDRNEVDNVRDIVALADIGEAQRLVNPDAVNIPPSPAFPDLFGNALPDNRANDLYERLINTPGARQIDQAVATLQNQFGMQQARDFEKVSARKLQPSEYTVHPELGFISLNVNVQPDQVVGVAFQYSYNGQTYKVGELSQNSETTQPDSSLSVLFVKMLKSTTQRTDVSTWDLMMKNVYAIGAFQVNREDFKLDIFYDDPGKGQKRFLPESNLTGRPLIRVFNLDNLNVQGDPQPDGVFDFVPGITITPRNGRIMFPVLEPFGSSLANQIDEPADREKFVYQELYDQTLFQAQEFPEKNRFVIRGSYKSNVSSEISLGAFNIPPGSVRVTAGGQVLREGVDYEIDYNIGRVRILNDAILNSGVPINVSFEDNTLFGFQLKSMFGLRADYEVDENFNIGATLLKLFERPFTQKVNIGDDPINNSIYGLDMSLSREAPWLTKAVDAIPLLSTKAPSNLSITAEAALLKPGHNRAINQTRKDKGGVVMIDDFEGAASSFDLRQPANQWFLASVPQNDELNNNPLFPESALINDIRAGANRARINWYRIDQGVRNDEDQRNPYTSTVPQVEVFPNLTLDPTQLPNVQTLDLTYYPQERGPYNFDVPSGYPGISAGISIDNVNDSLVLNDPETRWGGIMRALNTNDFQSANIEFLEFWMLSPFIDPQNPENPDFEGKDGDLYINLGNISEDILRDSRKFFENGLPGPANQSRRVDTTEWSVVPIAQQITRAFDNDPETRELQDVGLDGLDNAGERTKYDNYVQTIRSQNTIVGEKVARDPANDDYRYYRDPTFQAGAGILQRYRDYNNPEGNSRANQGGNRVQSATNIPDAEDLNRDNTLNETESYFQYRIRLRPDPLNPRELDREAAQFITDRRVSDDGNRIWYRFRIPLNGPDKVAVGGIRDFRSIRFMRMYLREFERPVTLRFARLELVRNTWRRYTQNLEEQEPSCAVETDFTTDVVNIERNSGREPFNYVLPLGIQREQSVGVFNTLQNEQSLSLVLRDLCDGDSRSVFKTVNMDWRVYDRFKMFVHAEELDEQEVEPGELTMFVRLGSDFKNNYYEYEVPLTMSELDNIMGLSPIEPEYKQEVWKPENEFDFPLQLLIDIKRKRNKEGFAIGNEYVEVLNPDNAALSHRVKVRGNPNLGYVKVAMVGVRNPQGGVVESMNTEVWANEMRLTGLDERGGGAAIARMDMQLADFGNLTVAGNYSSIGFGALDQKVQERQREEIVGFDVAADFQLGQFFPDKWGLRLPFYTQFSKTSSNPEFDPYDMDIRLKDKISDAETSEERDSIRRQAQDVSSLKSFTLTNVGKNRTTSKAPKPWDVENFSVSYAYSEADTRDPIIESDKERRHTAGLNYGFSTSPKYIEPFKNIQGKWLQLLSQFNFNLIPNSFTFSTIMDRRLNTTRYRFAGVDPRFNTFYNKSFIWDRTYGLQWDFTKSLKLTFNAVNAAVIDEPDEIKLIEDPAIENPAQVRRDSIWKNIANFGRTKNYLHNFQVSYNLPTRYLPIIDWIQVRAQYQAEYGWNAAALNVTSLGNVIQNRQDRQLNVDMNFEALYNKWGYLRDINRGSGGGARDRRAAPGRRPQQGQEGQQDRQRASSGPSGIEQALIRPLLLLRRGRFNWTEQFSTVVPGFMPESRLLGMNPGFEAPGFGFIAGWQPKIRLLKESEYGGPEDWLMNSARVGWISNDVLQNREVVQTFRQQYDLRATVEPFRDFRIDLELTRDFSENHTQFFKDTLFNDVSDFAHTVPQDIGSLTVTYSALSTLFRDSEDQIVDLFRTFEQNRVIVSQRLGNGEHDNPILAEQGYTKGYGRTQLDVLVPAFIAAYTDQNPRSVSLDLFGTKPRLNWRLNYNGLSRLPLFRELFQSFTLSHSYRSTLTVNSFNTSFDWLRTRNTAGGPVNELNGNFYPRFEIPQVAITEGFSPLIAVDARLNNGISIGVDYSKARTLGMSFVSNQLSETQTEQLEIAFGWLLRNVNLPSFGGNNNRGQGRDQNTQGGNQPQQPVPGGNLQGRDLNINFTFSMRDDVTFNHLLDQGIIEPTRGNYSLTISPSAEYQMSRNLSLRFFVDYRRNVPKTSAGFPRTDTSGGVMVRFQLN